MAYFRTGANDYSSLQYNNLTAGNIKNGVTVTIKDSDNTILKSVTGNYSGPSHSVTVKMQGNGEDLAKMVILIDGVTQYESGWQDKNYFVGFSPSGYIFTKTINF